MATIVDISKLLDQKLVPINEKLDSLLKLEKEVETLKESVVVHKREITLLQTAVRERNIIVFGVAEVESESVRELIVSNFGIRDFGSSRRLGKKGEKVRPILINCDTPSVKRSFVKACLEKKIGFADDLPREIRDARVSLLPALKEARRAGSKARILFPARLLVDGVVTKSAF